MTHSKEPWRAMGKWIDSCVDGDLFQEVAKCMKVKHGDGDANARRIVACVNALKGVPTALLEQAVELGVTDVSRTYLLEQYLQVCQQRDQLRAALAAIIKACDACEADDNKSLIDEFTGEIEQQARAALATTEDKQ